MVAVITKIQHIRYNHKFESLIQAKSYIRNVKETMPEAEIRIFAKVNIY